MKNTLITIIVLALLGGSIYYVINKSSDVGVETKKSNNISDKDIINKTDNFSGQTDINNDTEILIDEIQLNKREPKTIIGTSVNGNDIMAYHFGNGDTELLFIGGIHGGYSWNTALVAFELVDYLKANPNTIPENVTVSVIPVLNPDGLNTTVGSTGRFNIDDIPTLRGSTVSGRFNANNVDLNRNFDCDWQSNAMWKDQAVSGGEKAFSEPESQAIKNYIDINQPTAVVVWYSSAGGVFSSNCHNGPSPTTLTLTNIYADASGYPAYENFNFYEITGDMTNWFAKKDIPTISVLLTSHAEVEWDKNKAGIKAFIDFHAE